jgi:hypothetical protein
VTVEAFTSAAMLDLPSPLVSCPYAFGAVKAKSSIAIGEPTVSMLSAQSLDGESTRAREPKPT